MSRFTIIYLRPCIGGAQRKTLYMACSEELTAALSSVSSVLERLHHHGGQREQCPMINGEWARAVRVGTLDVKLADPGTYWYSH